MSRETFCSTCVTRCSTSPAAARPPARSPASRSTPIPIAGKTGTAEVQGHNDTSWFASFSSQYVVVISIPDTGQGALFAAPVARKVYEGIYGVNQPALLPTPPTALPKVTAP